jgi:hypothetical protein
MQKYATTLESGFAWHGILLKGLEASGGREGGGWASQHQPACVGYTVAPASKPGPNIHACIVVASGHGALTQRWRIRGLK